ncbi:N-acyl-D-amino-acid deacylase family protein [Microbacterium sp. SA39]|uniref:N-acyl-D-amino-acid deacylase family protein n=1 Tax=Microbacterium sp. SA39 TaxID=1263625 RepID=UPI0005F9C496|nr:amidohydrolase family protein [Microbacterium sp. SA39]KJQ55669.1 N-acyl-D-glutamate deacylase [Microbacterium sp. SA39]
MTSRTVLRGGSVVGATGVLRADVAIQDGLIADVGHVDARPGDGVVDVSDRLVLPGFIDAHSHADGLLGDPDVALTLLRQGVTTVIAGQDGVSYAPGSGEYASEYFAAINGRHPSYRGGGVDAYLASVEGTSAVNAGYLVPAGTVRFEVCGREDRPAGEDERRRMQKLVAQGMAEGALGLSTGLDYAPGIFQDASEIAALCEPVARAGGVYVTHMRGGYEANTAAGTGEIAEIARRATERAGATLPVHISHFHADADIVLAQLAALDAVGVDVTFDAYPYTRGCTLLGMPLLPPEVSALPVAEAVAVIADPSRRAALRELCTARAVTSASLGPEWAEMITLAHLAAPDLDWAHGLTLRDAAARAGVLPIDFALDALAASRLECSAVMAVRSPRSGSELARIFSHPAHMGGSDGIFIGAHPHPRAAGSFSLFLREYVRERATWAWPDAVHHLSTSPARRFGLGRRGTVEPGAIADLAIVDSATVADTATYADPRGRGVGIDDVFVAGIRVLAEGERTDALPGRGLRRAPRT